ncbi:Hypothetical predicted protein [Pelobates cultripes]|uniref:Uncharacterized protein n=1 Tax=Pelobates cultripes TaxID=61616 RepID=A0AAD1R6H4_PELCU|nr:Hypothetical predicted protein [Pelobates cultripes]
MGYIVSRREDTLIKLDEEITIWRQKLSDTTNPETFNQIIKEIKNKVEKAERDTITIKKKKYLRDTHDYKTGNVRFPKKKSNNSTKVYWNKRNVEPSQESPYRSQNNSQQIKTNRRHFRNSPNKFQSIRDYRSRRTSFRRNDSPPRKNSSYLRKDWRYSDAVKYSPPKETLRKRYETRENIKNSYPISGSTQRADPTSTLNPDMNYITKQSERENRRKNRDRDYTSVTPGRELREAEAHHSSFFQKGSVTERLKKSEQYKTWESPGKRQRPREREMEEEEEELGNLIKRGKR